MDTKPSIGFIGAGTVGRALARCLAGAGYRVVAVSSRSKASSLQLVAQVPGAQAFCEAQKAAGAAELVFVTTPDVAISQIAGAVRWRPGQMAVHCSGADSTDVLELARVQGAHVGVFHPLQSFATPTQALENLPGSTFALEGESPLIEVLESMAKALGGRSLRLRPEQKALYHASAVIASNYLVTLTALAASLWKEFGIERHEAVAALLPLVRGTVANIERVGIPDCLTGPIARGDSSTIRKHLDALAFYAPALLPLYRQLGCQAIPLALGKGTLTSVKAEEIRKLLAEEPATV